MTKLQIKSDRITSFGGIYLVNRLFDQFSLGKVINDTFGLRSTAHNGYLWDEIVKSLNTTTCVVHESVILTR